MVQSYPIQCSQHENIILKISNQIDAILPQTQCTQCGHPDCKAYAEAIAGGERHNQCPPGGDAVIQQLAELLNREVLVLNPNNGEHKPKEVAFIREDECIGCVKCIKACPVDAIIGTGKMMHTVLDYDCSGCGLCVPACPVDCIDMNLAVDQDLHSDYWRDAHQRRELRLADKDRLTNKQHQKNLQNKQDYIAAAVARSKNNSSSHP